MYKNTTCIIGGLAFILLFSFCSRKNKEAEKVFIRVENLIEQNPDSALLLLELIESPEELSLDNYANYLLLFAQSKDKSGISIAEDTLIRIPVSYFLQKKDIPKIALAYFYSGKVNYQQGENEKAIQDLLLAKDYAEKSGNNNLLGLIYYDLVLYDKEFNFESGLNNYRQSYDCFLKAGNEKNAVYILSFIGDVYLQQKPRQTYLAFENYNRVLQYAKQNNDTSLLTSSLRNIGIAYEEIEDYTHAKEFLLQSISIDKYEKYSTTNYAVLSQIYLSLNMPDSAIYYAERLPPNINYAGLHNYYELMKEIYAYISKHKQTSNNYRKKNERIALFYNQIIKQSALDIQKKYELEKLKNSLQKTELHKQFLFITVLLCIFGAILLICFFVIVIKRMRGKIRQIRQNLETMNEMLKDYDENKHSLKQVLLEQLDIAKKIAQLNVIPSNTAKHSLNENYFKIFGKDMTEKLDWNNLYPVINELYGGFVKKLRRKYPDLQEKQVQLCCLLRADFKTDEITFIQNYDNSASTQTQKNKLRIKMGFSGMKDLLFSLENM